MGEMDLRAFAKSMREADNETKKAVRRAVRVSVSDARNAVKKSAQSTLPKRGGLNEWTAALTVTVKQSYRGAGPVVTIAGQRKRQGGGKADMNRMNQGRTAHPVWGRYSSSGDAHGMFLQDVPPGFFDNAMTGTVVKQVQKQLEQTLAQALAKYFS